MQNQASDNPGVIALPPLIYGAGLAAGLLLHFLYPLGFLPEPMMRWMGIVPFGAAVALALPAQRALARARTPFDVRRPTSAIVTDGVFRYSRNPMYLALTLLHVGIATLLDSLWLLVVIVPVTVVVQLGVVAREERYLERKFGDEYLRYKRRVRRWI